MQKDAQFLHPARQPDCLILRNMTVRVKALVIAASAPDIEWMIKCSLGVKSLLWALYFRESECRGWRLLYKHPIYFRPTHQAPPLCTPCLFKVKGLKSAFFAQSLKWSVCEKKKSKPKELSFLCVCGFNDRHVHKTIEGVVSTGDLWQMECVCGEINVCSSINWKFDMNFMKVKVRKCQN